VLLGYPAIGDYQEDPYYVGATVGRVANRICNAEFALHDEKFLLNANEPPHGHCLHGGVGGLHRQDWRMSGSADGRSVVCRHRSNDGDQGFPGTVDFEVQYAIRDRCSLVIDFRAVTDTETVVNLANHAYFNLDGGPTTVDAHDIRLCADRFTPVDSRMIPTGELRSVDGSMFDLGETQALGSRVLDANFVVNGEFGRLRTAAEIASRRSGIRLRVQTTQPGMQVYTGDHLGHPFFPRQGICLEAQNFPNAPNEPAFPSARLLPGEIYEQRTVYAFATPQNGASGSVT